MALVVYDTKDGVSATGLTASSTVGPFVLLGGQYMVAVSDTGVAGGNLQMQMPDASFVNVASGSLSTATAVSIYLPAGTYKWVAASGITLGSFVCQVVPNFPAGAV